MAASTWWVGQVGTWILGMGTGQEATIPTLWLHLRAEFKVGHGQDGRGTPCTSFEVTQTPGPWVFPYRVQGGGSNTYRDWVQSNSDLGVGTGRVYPLQHLAKPCERAEQPGPRLLAVSAGSAAVSQAAGPQRGHSPESPSLPCGEASDSRHITHVVLRCLIVWTCKNQLCPTQKHVSGQIKKKNKSRNKTK